MAVDTRQKRFSMINMGSISTDLLPQADGTIDADDRRMFLDLYSGLAAATSVSGIPSFHHATFMRYRNRMTQSQ